MLGEYDLASGGTPMPGRRLTSMMSPTVVLGEDGRPRLVVGSAGSVRLRGAIMQTIVNVVTHGLPVAEAIDRPRVHVDEPHVHCEGGFDAGTLDALEALGYDVVRWRRRNLFFGGTNARRDAARRLAGRGRRPATRWRRHRRGRGAVMSICRVAVASVPGDVFRRRGTAGAVIGVGDLAVAARALAHRLLDPQQLDRLLEQRDESFHAPARRRRREQLLLRVDAEVDAGRELEVELRRVRSRQVDVGVRRARRACRTA